jgi:hypothetical protein
MTDRPRRRRTARITLFGAVIAAILGTGACSTLNDVQSPRSAREAAAAKSGHQPGGGVQFANCAVQKCIALTFDGGPSAPTPKLLDVLKKEHVHVTGTAARRRRRRDDCVTSLPLGPQGPVSKVSLLKRKAALAQGPQGRDGQGRRSAAERPPACRWTNCSSSSTRCCRAGAPTSEPACTARHPHT